MMAIDFG